MGLPPSTAQEQPSPVGHIPGFIEESTAAAPGRVSDEVYDRLLRKEWRRLIDSDDSQTEATLQTFLERHPSLLPGVHESMNDWMGRSPNNYCVVSQPKLPGLSDRVPDFMWMNVDSGSLYPILIEIETPHKPWFHGRGEINHQLTHAQGQLAEWRAWFKKGSNSSQFLDYYEVPSRQRRLQLSPRFILSYGRRENFADDEFRSRKRAELHREGEVLMSFDRLRPAPSPSLYACAKKRESGYEALSVPPSWSIINNYEYYSKVRDWDAAIDGCFDMATSRKAYLKDELQYMANDPERYTVRNIAGLRTCQPRIL